MWVVWKNEWLPTIRSIWKQTHIVNSCRQLHGWPRSNRIKWSTEIQQIAHGTQSESWENFLFRPCLKDFNFTLFYRERYQRPRCKVIWWSIEDKRNAHSSESWWWLWRKKKTSLSCLFTGYFFGFSENSFGETGARALIEALRVNTALKELSVQGKHKEWTFTNQSTRRSFYHFKTLNRGSFWRHLHSVTEWSVEDKHGTYQTQSQGWA